MSALELQLEIHGISVYVASDAPSVCVVIDRNGEREAVTFQAAGLPPASAATVPVSRGRGVGFKVPPRNLRKADASVQPEEIWIDEELSPDAQAHLIANAKEFREKDQNILKDAPVPAPLLTDDYLLPSGRKVVCPLGQVLSRPEQEAVQQLARMAAPKPGVLRAASLKDPYGSILRVMTDDVGDFKAYLIAVSLEELNTASSVVIAMFDDKPGSILGCVPADEQFKQPQDFDLLWLGEGVTDVDEIGYWWKHIKPGGYLCGRGYAVDDGITAALDQIVEGTKGLLPLVLVNDTPVWYIQQPIPQ